MVEEDTYIMLWPLYVHKWVGTHVLTCISTWRERDRDTQRDRESQKQRNTQRDTEIEADR